MAVFSTSYDSHGVNSYLDYFLYGYYKSVPSIVNVYLFVHPLFFIFIFFIVKNDCLHCVRLAFCRASFA